MVSTTPIYFIAVAIGFAFLLLAALISIAIKYEGGSNPQDPKKRKIVFWTMTILAPIVNLVFGLLVYYYPTGNTYARDQLIKAIGIGSGISFIVCLLFGFILSKMFPNGKLGNWF